MEIETLSNRIIRKCKLEKSFIFLPISKFIIYNNFFFANNIKLELPSFYYNSHKSTQAIASEEQNLRTSETDRESNPEVTDMACIYAMRCNASENEKLFFFKCSGCHVNMVSVS